LWMVSGRFLAPPGGVPAMRPSVFPALALTVACELALLVAESPGQQPSPSPSNATRRGYYSRVQSQSGGVARSRYASSRSATASDALAGEPDPLRPYGNAGGASGTAPRPYEREPVASPPRRETPAPVASHNYFPGLRSGQSANRNVVPHCVPGRNSFYHR
jgi:hypothetical protein